MYPMFCYTYILSNGMLVLDIKVSGSSYFILEGDIPSDDISC